LLANLPTVAQATAWQAGALFGSQHKQPSSTSLGDLTFYENARIEMTYQENKKR